MDRPRNELAALALLTMLFAGLMAFWVLHRAEMLDEGWYAYAGKLAWRGQRPWHDFAYFQAPLLPYLYGIPQALSPGLLSGRIGASAFALGTWFLTLGIARRLAGPRAAVLAALLLLASPYLGSHFPIVLTYSPAAFFLMLAVHALVCRRLLLCLLAASVAAGIRLSVAPAVPLLVAAAWRTSGRSRVDALRLAIGGTVVLVSAAAFVLPDPAVAWHDLVGYHAAGIEPAERVRRALSSAAGSVATAAVLLVPAVLVPILRREVPHGRTLVGVTAVVFAANLVPTTTAPYYQSVLLPLLALLAGMSLARITSTLLLAAVLGAHLAGQLEPVHRFSAVRRAPGAPVLSFERCLPRLAEVGRELRRAAPPPAKVFTLATYFAVEADVDVMPGLEMSIFSIDWEASEEECRRRHTVNPAMIRQWFVEGVPDVVLLTSWDVKELGGRVGPILSPLAKRYAVRSVYRRVGQLDGDAFLITRLRPDELHAPGSAP